MALSVTNYMNLYHCQNKTTIILGHKYSMGSITLNICRPRENPKLGMIKYYSQHRWRKTLEIGRGGGGHMFITMQ